MFIPSTMVFIKKFCKQYLGWCYIKWVVYKLTPINTISGYDPARANLQF